MGLLKTTIGKTVFCALISFQALFGTYYSWSEFKKGTHFDPFLSPSEFQEKVLRPAVTADIPAGDIESYLKAANSIASRGNYTLESGLPSAWVTPGYPFALALSFKLFGFHFWSVLLLNTLAWGFAFLAVLKITELLGFSNLESILTLILFAGNLRLSMFVGYVYTECLFIAVSAWFLVHYLRAFSSEKPLAIRSAIQLGLLAGFGILVRPILLGTAPLFLVFALFRKKPTFSWMISLGLAITPVSIWVLRNTTELGHPVLSTSSALARAEGSQDFYLPLPVFGIFKKVPIQFPYERHEVGKYDRHPELDIYITAKNYTTEWNSTHSFGDKFHLFLQRMVALFSPYIEAMSPRNQGISFFYWILIFPTAAIGMFFLRQSLMAWIVFSFCLLLLFYPSLVVVSSSLRYQIPGQVLLSPIAAMGITRLFKRRKA